MLARLRTAVQAELARRLASDPALGKALAASALACCGGEPATFRCAPGLEPLLPTGAIVDASLTGVIAELASGTTVDATLLVALDREWPRLAAEVAR
jgi:hypothetical protein